MKKQTIAVIVAAVVLFVVAVVGALAFTGSDSGARNVHEMPNGQMMTGMMDDSMMGHTMPGGQTMTGPMHTMSGGEQMPGMTHP
jgi:hypothetical protein